MVLGITLPFLNHAYHIDEPLFLRIAQQIKESPLHPFDFQYLWHIDVQPVHEIAAFPPLFPYYLALASWASFYPSETLIHLSLIPFALLGVLSFYLLCREFDFSPEWSFLTSAFFALSPAYALSANMAMPDVAATSLSLASVVLSIHGWKRRRISFLILGGCLIGLACLMRYNALPILGILMLLGLTYANFQRAWIPSLTGVSILSAWTLWSRQTSGRGHISETLNVFANTSELIKHFWALNNHVALTALLPVLVLILIRKKPIFWAFLAAFFSLDFALFAGASGQVKHFALWPDVLFFGMGALTFFYAFHLFWRDLKLSRFWNLTSEKTAEGKKWILLAENLSEEKKISLRYLILFLWIVSVFLLPLIYVMFASKYMLLALPPFLLILLRELTKNGINPLRLARYLLPPVFLLSLVVAKADFDFADLYRKAAQDFSRLERPTNGRIWFTGHWGWQYYMEKVGGIPLPYHFKEEEGPVKGDLVVTTESTSPQPLKEQFKERLALQKEKTEFLGDFLRTMNHPARAGFYSDYWGPLPYAFSLSPVETFRVYTVSN